MSEHPEWRGVVKIDRQMNAPQTAVLIRSHDRLVFRMVESDAALAARFGERITFYAAAVIHYPVDIGPVLEGPLELGDEMPAETWEPGRTTFTKPAG